MRILPNWVQTCNLKFVSEALSYAQLDPQQIAHLPDVMTPDGLSQVARQFQTALDEAQMNKTEAQHFDHAMNNVFSDQEDEDEGEGGDLHKNIYNTIWVETSNWHGGSVAMDGADLVKFLGLEASQPADRWERAKADAHWMSVFVSSILFIN
ncbi:hypothetical protein I317_01455 [Kwoniella heveanensis CBS 569]|nr:hypothetical protein I317_01455 [Kwoniella heveanensis CBS 569]